MANLLSRCRAIDLRRHEHAHADELFVVILPQVLSACLDVENETRDPRVSNRVQRLFSLRRGHGAEIALTELDGALRAAKRALGALDELESGLRARPAYARLELEVSGSDLTGAAAAFLALARGPAWPFLRVRDRLLVRDLLGRASAVMTSNDPAKIARVEMDAHQLVPLLRRVGERPELVANDARVVRELLAWLFAWPASDPLEELVWRSAEELRGREHELDRCLDRRASPAELAELLARDYPRATTLAA